MGFKRAVCDRFNGYLYGSKFTVRTDNNPLTNVLTTAKLDATGHRWLAALSGYNFSLVYRAGRKNQNADALSPLPYTNKETLFNDVIKAISQAVLVSGEEAPVAECVLLTQSASLNVDEPDTNAGLNLCQIDWPADQTVDITLNHVR